MRILVSRISISAEGVKTKTHGEQAFSPSTIAEFGNGEEAKVCNDDTPILQEDVLGFEILVNDTPSMEVSYTL